jgi:hypothetical protein
MNASKIFILLIAIALVSSCRKKDQDECPVCPVVEGISPSVAHGNDTVTITGKQFAASNNIVKLNGVSATILSQSESKVVALVPPNCGTGPVSVDIDDELTSNRNVIFTYTYKYTITTLAGVPGGLGETDGIATAARFNFPKGIVSDKSGNVYVADRSNNCIRKIKSGIVSTFAGKKGLTGGFVNSANPLLAEFNFPYGMDINSSGELFVADLFNDAIRKILPSGAVSTLAGKGGVAGDVDGIGINAQFNWPSDLTIFQDSILFVADYLNNKIKRVSANGRTITLAGNKISGNTNGTLATSSFFFPLGISMFDNSSFLIVDNGNVKIRSLNFSSNTTADFAGAGIVGAFNGRSSSATFNYPTDVAIRTIGGQKEVFVADQSNNVIRLIDPSGIVSTVVGDGVPGFKNGEGIQARLNRPYGIAFDAVDNSILYITDEGNHCIRKVVIE